MKKVCSLALAVCCLLSIMVMAASADATFTNSTKLTTTVPAASYVMHIPADQTIKFGATSTNIGNVTITNASGFARGKNLEITVTHDDFRSDSVETIIAYDLKMIVPTSGKYPDSSVCKQMIFKGQSDGTVYESASKQVFDVGGGTSEGHVDHLTIEIASDIWGKALAGEYSSTITFTSAVVVEK